MPHVMVKLASGRSEAQKSAIAEALTKAIVATAEVGEDTVSVAIEDVPREDWVEQVYRPDILPRLDSLQKKPDTTRCRRFIDALTSAKPGARSDRKQENQMTADLSGKVALVTGAAAGTGLAAARAFAETGASVVVADRNGDMLTEAADVLRSAGHRITSVACDVTDRAPVAAMVEAAVAVYGRLDAAFNNAGIHCDGAPVLETDDAEFDDVIDVNLRGTWNCMKAELRQTTAQGIGAIVNCSSIGGLRGSKGRAAYSASKFGVIGMTRAAALDYADKGIRINAVCPGIIGNTPMAVQVSKNNDPDIVRKFVAAEPVGAPASRRRSPPPWFGYAARPRASCLATPSSSTAASSPEQGHPRTSMARPAATGVPAADRHPSSIKEDL